MAFLLAVVAAATVAPMVYSSPWRESVWNVKLGGEVGHVVELAHHLLHELGGRQRVVQGEMLVHRNTVVNGPLYFFSGVPVKGTF